MVAEGGLDLYWYVLCLVEKPLLMPCHVTTGKLAAGLGMFVRAL